MQPDPVPQVDGLFFFFSCSSVLNRQIKASLLLNLQKLTNYTSFWSCHNPLLYFMQKPTYVPVFLMFFFNKQKCYFAPRTFVAVTRKSLVSVLLWCPWFEIKAVNITLESQKTPGLFFFFIKGKIHSKAFTDCSRCG